MTVRTKCPNCGERTFTVTNNMGSLVWNCFRASCNVKGGTRVRISVDDIRAGFGGAQEFAEDTFDLPPYVVDNLDNLFLKRFCATWGIDPKELGLLYDVKEDRLVFPIKHEGRIVDATGRSLSKRLPKWKRYGKSGLPYTSGCGKVAVVVEDCLSAAVVGYGTFVGVALLGTSLQESHKRYSLAVLNSHRCARPRCATEDFADGKGTTRTRQRCSCSPSNRRPQIS